MLLLDQEIYHILIFYHLSRILHSQLFQLKLGLLSEFSKIHIGIHTIYHIYRDVHKFAGKLVFQKFYLQNLKCLWVYS